MTNGIIYLLTSLFLACVWVGTIYGQQQMINFNFMINKNEHDCIYNTEKLYWR